jgi:hypothetical protein
MSCFTSWKKVLLLLEYYCLEGGEEMGEWGLSYTISSGVRVMDRMCLPYDERGLK